MSTTFYTPATIRVRSRGSGLIATVKKWWMSYFTRRIEWPAIIHLHGMSERELQDIGLTRSQIERAVREDVAAMRRVVLSYRERAIIIRPMDSGLRGITLRYVYEIRGEAEIFAEIPEMIRPKEMLSVAEHIADWRPRTF